MRGSSKAIPRQLRPTPARRERLASREALANFHIDQENLFEPVPDGQAHVLPPLPDSPLSPSFPGFLDFNPRTPLPETTPLPDSPSSPSSLHLTPLSPLSVRSYRSNSPDSIEETSGYIHLPYIPPPIPVPTAPYPIVPSKLPPPTMSSTSSFHMPLRGTPNAPKFDGNPEELLRYFEDIEQLADAANLSDDARIKAAI